MNTKSTENEQEPQEFWFRYSDPWEAGDAPCVDRFRVVRRTKCGVWLDAHSGEEKFVLHTARRRFAYPTHELALDSYIIRKRHQIAHAEGTKAKAALNLSAAQRLQRGEEKPQPNLGFPFTLSSGN